MTENDPRIELATRYSQMALHNLGESEKLRAQRVKRLDILREKAQHQVLTRPTVSHNVDSILDSLARNDPRLDEYGAGLVIVERRAALYASMATDLRLQVLTDILGRGERRDG